MSCVTCQVSLVRCFFQISSKHCQSKKGRARELNFERMDIPHHVSHVTCHASRVRCLISGVMCQVSHVCFLLLLFYRTNWWIYLVEGLLSTGLPCLVWHTLPYVYLPMYPFSYICTILHVLKLSCIPLICHTPEQFVANNLYLLLTLTKYISDNMPNLLHLCIIVYTYVHFEYIYGLFPFWINLYTLTNFCQHNFRFFLIFFLFLYSFR